MGKESEIESNVGDFDDKQTEKQKELLTKLRERFDSAIEADQDSRQDAMEDMKFINVPGYQWDENMKAERGDRPCYEFNKIRVTAKRIINNMRANRPSGKVRPTEDGDKKVAEIYEGLIRNIWNQSDGDTVVDYAAEYQVSGGLGAWRIGADYIDDDVFEQDLKIEAIPNPFCLFSDPAAKDLLKQDARFWILTEKIAKEVYEQKYPKADIVEFQDHEFDDDEEWETKEEVRVCEYWYKEPVEKEIWQLSDGKVIDADSDEAAAIANSMPEMVVRTRKVKTDKIMMCIASGNAILEGPVEWPGKHFPFIQVHGEYHIIDGKTHWGGIGKFAKDAQRSYNVSRTAITETIAQAPQAKWFATAEQAKGHTKQWAEAHRKNFPFLLYNADPKAPGAPTRIGGADVPVALIQESQIASEEIKAVTGIFDDDLGDDSRSQSGRAIIARQQMGAVATFNYEDNLAKGIQLTWKILVDLIPKYYDTERELRILGEDGAEDYVRINTFAPGPDGTPIKINDITHGRYDVNITVGPNFTTKRQEAAETYQQLLQGAPDLMGVIGDLVFKSMDLPYAEDIADRLKTMLPPQIQQMLNGDAEVPPEVQAMMAQAQQAMAQVEQQMQVVQEAAAEAEKEVHQSEKAKAEVEQALANLQTEQARFEAKIAKELAKLSQREAKITQSEIVNEKDGVIETERAQLNEVVAKTMAESINAINQLAAQFNAHAVETLEAIRQNIDSKPRISRIESKRENGSLVAVPVYEDRSIPGSAEGS